MPLVKIEIIKGQPAEYKGAFMDAVRGAMESSLGIPSQSLNLRLYELERDCVDITSEKSDKFCLIEVGMVPGRSREAKGAMIKEIAGRLTEGLGVPLSDITILINDPPLDNWAPGGVQR